MTMGVPLTVYVPSGSQEMPLFRLAFDVYSRDGDLIGQGMALQGANEIDVVAEVGDTVFVRARLPDGRTTEARVLLAATGSSAWLLGDVPSPHEWMQWATPFRDMRHIVAQRNAPEPRELLQGDLWATLWRYTRQQWVAEPIPTGVTMDEGDVKLLNFDVPHGSHLLQIGGTSLAWRLIALPPEGGVRVGIARAAPGQEDGVDVVVSRSNPDLDLMMSLLARNELREAAQLGRQLRLLERIQKGEFMDPLSSLMAAFYLVRAAPLESRQAGWTGDVAKWPRYLPDCDIVEAALALQRRQPDVRLASVRALEVTRRGLPLFTAALDLWVETLEVLLQAPDQRQHLLLETLRMARTYQAARATKGAYLSFYGLSPTKPTMEHIRVAAAPTPVESVDAVSSAARSDDDRPASAPPVLFGRTYRAFFPWVELGVGAVAVASVLLPILMTGHGPGDENTFAKFEMLGVLGNPLVLIPLAIAGLVYFRRQERRQQLQDREQETRDLELLGPAVNVRLYKGGVDGLRGGTVMPQKTRLNRSPGEPNDAVNRGISISRHASRDAGASG